MLNAAPSDPKLAQPRRRRWLAYWTVALVMIAFIGGFFWYATQVPQVEPSFERSADAIVALTGGRERIGDAVELLAAGRGKRLLISGVNPTTRAE